MSNECSPRRLYLREQAQNTGEVPDPTPVEASLVPPPLSLREEMRRFIKQELSQQAAESGEFETFEESDDFSIEEDEPDFTTGYTVNELDNPEVRYDDLEGDPAADTTEPPTTPADQAEDKKGSDLTESE